MVDIFGLPGLIGEYGFETDPPFANNNAYPQKIRIFALHRHTQWYMDDDQLAGKQQLIPEFDVFTVWFEPENSYNGTVFFETSPDGCVTWFPIQGVSSAVLDVLVDSVATPTSGVYYIVYVPSWCHFRVRMEGGTQGSLSAFGKMSNFDFSNAV
jgi:hypothetical protein